MKNLTNLDRLLKLQSLNNLHFGSKKSLNLIDDFTNYFDMKNDKFNNIDMFRIVHWYEIFEELKHIFARYYMVEPNDKNTIFIDTKLFPLHGSFVNLIPNYKDKLVKDVYTVYIKSAYPQQIDKMFLAGMKADDPYLPFIFHLVYKGVKTKTQLRKIFINYLYGILTSEKSKFKLTRSIYDVPEFYNTFWRNIDTKLYYYVDTDSIMCSKTNVKKITDIMQSQYIEFEIEEQVYDVLFLEKKRYVQFLKGKYKTMGLQPLQKTAL